MKVSQLYTHLGPFGVVLVPQPGDPYVIEKNRKRREWNQYPLLRGSIRDPAFQILKS